jgi:hypothetical protein
MDSFPSLNTGTRSDAIKKSQRLREDLHFLADGESCQQCPLLFDTLLTQLTRLSLSSYYTLAFQK